jgi:hypothetical protein
MVRGRVVPVFLLAWVATVSFSARAADSEPPVIDHEEVQVARAGQALPVRAAITDPSGVFDPTILYRVGDNAPFLRASMREVEGGVFEGEIPEAFVREGLEYFIEAYDEEGNGPARFGDETFAVSVRVVAADAPDSEANPDPTTAGDAKEGGSKDAALVDGSTTTGASNAPAVDESEGAPIGLYVGAGVGAGAVVLVVVGAAAAGAVAAIWYFTRPDPPDAVTITVDAPSPVNPAGGG